MTTSWLGSLTDEKYFGEIKLTPNKKARTKYKRREGGMVSKKCQEMDRN